MSQKVDFKSEVMIVGKEFMPKREEMIINNQKVAAKDDTFNLYVMFGTFREGCTDFFDTKPTVLSVEVDKMDYLRIKKPQLISATLRQDNGKLSIRKLDGIPVILRKEDTDEEDLFAREIAEIERMEQLSAAAEVKKTK